MHDSSGCPPSAPQTRQVCHHTYFSCLPRWLLIWFCLLGPSLLLPLIQIFSHFQVLLSAHFQAVTRPVRSASPLSLHPHQAFVHSQQLVFPGLLTPRIFLPTLLIRIAFPVTNLNILVSIRSLLVITESRWFMINGIQSSFQSGPLFHLSSFFTSGSSHSGSVFSISQQSGSFLIVVSENVPMKLFFKALLGFYASPFFVKGNQVFI